MSNQKNTFRNLPFSVPYTDDIEYVQNSLKVISVVFKLNLTPRNIDLLSLCILEDVNKKGFRELVVNSGMGLTNENSVNTELSRLRKKNYLVKDGYNKDHLQSPFKELRELYKADNPNKGIYLAYYKK
jgi:hypothetical protein